MTVRRWRGAALAAAGALAAVGLLAAGPTRDASAAAASQRTPFVQQYCPGTVAVYPPLGASNADTGTFYGVPVATRITGGTLTIGKIVRTTGLTATICGLLKFPELTASIPGATCTRATEATGCFDYGPAVTSIDKLVDLPTTFTPGPSTVTVAKQAAPNGGLDLEIRAEVTTHVYITRFHVDCSVGPIDVEFTTTTSGPLSGKDVTGSLYYGATARIVGATFAVPGANATLSCPEGLIPATDQLVGLPAAPGVAQFSAPLTLANSLQ